MIMHLTVNDVEFKQDETIVHMAVDYPAGGYICFPKHTKLMDQDGKEYALKSGEPTRSNEDSCKVDQWLQISPSGRNEYALHFEPLPETTERFHFIESYEQNGFRVWNITSSETKPAIKADLFDSNWRNDQTGDWMLGLYAENAVYDSKVWQYEEKSEKKVVLANGNDKLTIAIGKEKNGIREFNVNGKKIKLSRFDSNLPAYPTADETAFSKELKKGEATITGIIKNFPRELSNGKITYYVFSNNIVTRNRSNIDVEIDSTGVFSVKVPVYGTSQIQLKAKMGDFEVNCSDLVVEPGKSYFMVQDYNRNTSLFMGENARLMNELSAFPATILPIFTTQSRVNYEIIAKFTERCMKHFEKGKEKLDGMTANHPTLSKRYRDFTLEFNSKETASSLIMQWFGAPNYTLPADVVASAHKLGDANSTLPVSLTLGMDKYMIDKDYNEDLIIKQRYYETPEMIRSFEKKGLITLTDEDRTTLDNWVKRNEEGKRIGKLPAEQRQEAYAKIDEKFGSYNNIEDLLSHVDIMDAYNQWAPSDIKRIEMFTDSIYKDKYMHDLSLARNLAKILNNQKKPLDNEGQALLGKIENSEYKVLINETQEGYLKEMAERAKKADEVIYSVSAVEGLTDGKEILDKLVAPYKGKIVYVDLWGIGCRGCMINLRQYTPQLKQKVKDYDIVYLYLTAETNLENWKFYITELNLIGKNEVHYNLTRKQFTAIGEYIKAPGVPRYLLFDKDGNMEYLDRNHLGDLDGFKKKIEEMSKK